MRGRIVVLSCDPTIQGVAEGLVRRGFSTRVAKTVAQAGPDAELDGAFGPDAILVDLGDDAVAGLEDIARLARAHADIPVICIAAVGALETAIGAMRAGAYDYLSRPLRQQVVVHAVDRAVERRQRHVAAPLDVVKGTARHDDLVGESAPMRDLYDMIERVARSHANTLVVGETGTGKEVVARALHRRSRRAAGPFVALNCAAVPENLLESELFGHLKGAFTDAHRDRQGLFAQASGGTVFLDEIGDLPRSLQPKLLRALQERLARPVGGDREVPFDVRVVAATNADLEADVDAGRFRRDLYFRLNVIQLDIPPLRARGTDILLLAEHFLTRMAAREDKPVRTISPEARRMLLDYPFPGNVRELENCVERAVALARTDEVTVNDLPPRVRAQAHTVQARAADVDELVPMKLIEERYVRRVLHAVAGNKTVAARVLGFDRKTLYRKLIRYGLMSADDAGDLAD